MENYKTIELIGTDNEYHSIEKYKGKYLILYFYPKDSTPGCAIQGKKYTELLEKFHKNKICVLGISKGSLQSKLKFSENQKYKHVLLNDNKYKLANALEVLKEKSMFGKKYLGIQRSSFIFDKNSNLIKKNYGVNPLNDATNNLKYIIQLINNKENGHS